MNADHVKAIKDTIGTDRFDGILDKVDAELRADEVRAIAFDITGRKAASKAEAIRHLRINHKARRLWSGELWAPKT